VAVEEAVRVVAPERLKPAVTAIKCSHKLNSLKTEKAAFDKIASLSGWGVNQDTGNLEADPDVMREYFDAHPEQEKYREGLEFADELENLFGNGYMATGSAARSFDELDDEEEQVQGAEDATNEINEQPPPKKVKTNRWQEKQMAEMIEVMSQPFVQTTTYELALAMMEKEFSSKLTMEQRYHLINKLSEEGIASQFKQVNSDLRHWLVKKWLSEAGFVCEAL
jgi:hypothetical protein